MEILRSGPRPRPPGLEEIDDFDDATDAVAAAEGATTMEATELTGEFGTSADAMRER